MDVSATMKKFGLEAAFKYLQRDPERNLLRLMDWADRFAGDEFVSQRNDGSGTSLLWLCQTYYS